MAAELVRATIISWFLAHGYQPYQAEVLARSAFVETRYNYCVIARSGSAYLFQWVGSRRTALRRFAGTSGCPALETQLAFADHELRTVPSYRRFWLVSDSKLYGWVRSCYEGGRC